MLGLANARVKKNTFIDCMALVKMRTCVGIELEYTLMGSRIRPGRKIIEIKLFTSLSGSESFISMKPGFLKLSSLIKELGVYVVNYRLTFQGLGMCMGRFDHWCVQ